MAKSALMLFGGRCGVSYCGMRDYTDAGAGIRLRHVKVLRTKFELTFDNFSTVKKCQPIWRQGDFAGVAFV
jgi:hypothetical protein